MKLLLPLLLLAVVGVGCKQKYQEPEMFHGDTICLNFKMPGWKNYEKFMIYVSTDGQAYFPNSPEEENEN